MIVDENTVEAPPSAKILFSSSVKQQAGGSAGGPTRRSDPATGATVADACLVLLVTLSTLVTVSSRNAVG